jgi:hypothetical protein
MAFTSETAKKAGSLSSRKGTPNKATIEVRESLKSLLEFNIETMQDDLLALEPKDRLKVLLELTKFVIPTLKATELTNKEGFKQIEVKIINLGNGTKDND